MRVFLQQKNKCNYHFLFGILVDFIILVQYRSLKASRRRPWAVAINILKKNESKFGYVGNVFYLCNEERKQLKAKQYEKGKHQQPTRLPYGDSQ